MTQMIYNFLLILKFKPANLLLKHVVIDCEHITVKYPILL